MLHGHIHAVRGMKLICYYVALMPRGYAVHVPGMSRAAGWAAAAACRECGLGLHVRRTALRAQCAMHCCLTRDHQLIGQGVRSGGAGWRGEEAGGQAGGCGGAREGRGSGGAGVQRAGVGDGIMLGWHALAWTGAYAMWVTWAHHVAPNEAARPACMHACRMHDIRVAQRMHALCRAPVSTVLGVPYLGFLG